MATSSVSAQQFSTLNRFAAPPKVYVKAKLPHAPVPPTGRRQADPSAPAEAAATPINPLQFTKPSGTVLDATADASGVFKVASLL
jgi:hypothetical protein